jgi:hypothetical protein
MKLCECGCGHPAPVAPKTDTRQGWVRGQPKRFIHGHNRRGQKGVYRAPQPHDGLRTYVGRGTP